MFSDQVDLRANINQEHSAGRFLLLVVGKWRLMGLLFVLTACATERQGEATQSNPTEFEYATWQDHPHPFQGKQVWQTPDGVIERMNEATLIETLCPDIEEQVRTTQGLYEKVLEVALLQCFGTMGWELVSRADERDVTFNATYTLYTFKRPVQ